MDVNFTNGISFDGATISMDFFLAPGAPGGRRIDFGMQIAAAGSPAEAVDGANFSPFAIKVRHDGQVHNSSGVANGFPNDAFSDFSHFGSDVWQNATASFSFVGPNADNPSSADDWRVDLTFTNLVTNAILSDTQTVVLNADVKNQEFTQIYVRRANTGDGYADNIRVTTTVVPEPASIAIWLLMGLGLGLGWLRHNTPT